MTNFHSDPGLIINALRFILESYKLYRSRSGKKLPEKEEEVLEETVVRAEEMSAEGASTETVVSEIETNLERQLGKAAKDEIVNRASSILALAHPFELQAFQYYENLNQVLKRAQDFCASANIFQLRGATNGTFSVLPMPQLDNALQKVTENFGFLCEQLQRAQSVLKAATAKTGTFLSTRPAALHVKLVFNLTRSRSIGGSYSDAMAAELALSSGSEVNKVGFNVVRPTESPYLIDFEIRLTGKEFQQIISAILDDIHQYVSELAEEERDFKERLAPQLAAVLAPWASK